jgi:hypothetical protein
MIRHRVMIAALAVALAHPGFRRGGPGFPVRAKTRAP